MKKGVRLLMKLTRFLSLLTLGLFRFVMVSEGTCQVVTRFGRYVKSLRPGLRGYFSAWGICGSIYHFTMTDPYTLKPKSGFELDTKEIVFDYPEEKVISKDNVQFQIDAIVYFKIVDPKKALFNVTDCVAALHNTVQSILRAEVGKHPLEECYSNRVRISEDLTREADQIASAWGIDVLRLEVQEFDIGTFADQLLRQKEQEIEKRQEILHAEGLMEAKIREAEGQKEAEIRVAEGKRIAAEAEADTIRIRAQAEAEAAKIRSDAEAYGFRVIAEALGNDPLSLQRYLVLHSAEIISHHLAHGEAVKLFLPSDAHQLLKSFIVAQDLLYKE